MKPADRQKMCTSCEGRIPIEAAECPYCAAAQGDPNAKNPQSSQAPLFKHQSLQDSLTSLYTPPYPSKNSHPPAHAPLAQAPLMTEKKEKEFFKEVQTERNPLLPQGAGVGAIPTSEQKQEEAVKSGLLPTVMLCVAGNLMTLGLFQFFFSDQGLLRLEWQSSYWFLYCLASIPLIFFGLKKAKEL